MRACRSIIKTRQDDAVEAGVVPLLVQVLTGCHRDRDTLLHTTLCIRGIVAKIPEACATFRDAGAEATLAAIIEMHSECPVRTWNYALRL